VQGSHQRNAVYDSERSGTAFSADVLIPGTSCVVGRHQSCWRSAPCHILSGGEPACCWRRAVWAELIWTGGFSGNDAEWSV